MVLARSIIRIGGRRVVIARRQATADASRWFTRATALCASQSVTPRPSIDRWHVVDQTSYRTLVTASNVARVEDASPVDVALTSDDQPGPSTRNIAQTSHAGEVAAKLAAVHDLLVNDVGGSEEWVERVNSALDDLQRPRVPVLAVWGDELSSPSSFITSLLLDPLSEDPVTRDAILGRHSEGSNVPRLMISDGTRLALLDGPKQGSDAVRRDVGALEGDIPWLRRAGMQVMEVLDHHPPTILSHLLQSDFPTIILDPIRLISVPTLEAILPSLVTKPSLRFIINGPVPSLPPDATTSSRPSTVTPQDATRTRLRRQLSPFVPRAMAETLAANAVFADSASGIQAAEALRDALVADPGSSTGPSTERSRAFREYQERYMESNLAEVKNVLGDVVRKAVAEMTKTETVDSPERAGRALQTRTAEHVVKSTIAHVHGVLATLTESLSEAEDMADSLSKLSATTKHTALPRVTQSSDVHESVDIARRSVEDVWRKRLSWWRVVLGGGGVDGAVDELEDVVRLRWAQELAGRLSYDAGTLSTIQSELSTEVDRKLSSFSPSHDTINPTHPFHSPLLLNHLAQVSATTSIPPPAFLGPITTRRTTLLTALLPRVQRTARVLVWTTYSLAFLSASATWTCAVPLSVISGQIAWPAFLLTTGGVLRWAVGRWARAERVFWKDWKRVEEGLVDDVSREVGGVVDGRLVAKVEEAEKGLRELCRRRKEQLEEVAGRVEEVARL